MSFPATRKALEEAGYTRISYTRCQGCGMAMEMWRTPKKSSIPMNSMPQDDSPATSHFANCPEAVKFRRKTR